MPLVSFADLYAGKAVATLDRQHPRDLFDARDLLANEGIDDALRQAFVAYMLSHDRPMFEVLAPTRKDIKDLFEREKLSAEKRGALVANLEKVLSD
jgi:predicted nucleotidyltransferase component of viral defense system